ncbi:hypothetical protein QYS60_24825 [Rhodococcus sp. GXMU-t2271]|uniref:Uncharacterized protein n=1 Tax=Rhodococcus indonesiensis TaxID=3055869 RepID=A0ABT7RGJ9_9NOCA|nr:hypothetical protein [Rhodococcus indonesiensis]MDM7486762.1 hypothetical protein [Rhodococcus indonesiensis]
MSTSQIVPTWWCGTGAGRWRRGGGGAAGGHGHNPVHADVVLA